MNFFHKILYKFYAIKPSFSQCGEDLIIDHIFRQLKKNEIFYLDIGTNDPQTTNNTYLFYKNGHKGICVEPNPALIKQIKKVRPRDLCLNLGVALSEESDLDFYVMEPHTLSTFSKSDAEEMSLSSTVKIDKVIKVPTLRINEIFSSYVKDKLDFLSIDVEGLNEEIIIDLDLTKYRPTVVCIETITFSEVGDAKKLNRIIDKFLANNYFLYADTYLNTIFIDKQQWKY